jgi:hypothetical protein
MKLMTKLVALAFVSVAALTPLAVGHDAIGTPNTTCQDDTGDYRHDYLLGTGRLVGEYQDGNLDPCSTRGSYGLFLFSSDGDQANCGGSSNPCAPPDATNECDGTENAFLDDPFVDDPFNTILPALPGPAYEAVCNTDRPADWDGDYDWAIGGAVLSWDLPPPSSAPQASCGGTTACETSSASPNCTTTYPGCFDSVRGGGEYCWGFDTHTHSGIIYADANVLGAPTLVGGQDLADFIQMTATTNWRRSAFDALPGNGQENCGDTLVEPCGLPGQIDQVNCNGRDWKDSAKPGAYTEILGGGIQKQIAGPAVGGQDGVVMVFIGSLGCPIAEATSGTDACVNTVANNIQTAAIGGHIWT